MNNGKTESGSASRGLLLVLGCLVAILTIIFWKSFLPHLVVFSNDGPLGVNVSASAQFPQAFTGWWQDLNWLGNEIPAPAPNFSSALRLVIGPYMYAKFYPFASLLFLGLCTWFFFRQLKFNQVVCILGAIAAMLNGNFFSNMAWGQGSRPLTLAFSFLALAALHSALVRRSWMKAILAGFAVGLAVTEGFDVGAIFSLYIAAFVVVFVLVNEGAPLLKLTKGGAWLAIVAVCAGLIAAQTLHGLVTTQIQGVVGTEQTPEAKEAQWNFSTQWSTPKLETLRVFVPGIFGYRMNDGDGRAYDGGYWGRVGQSAGAPTSRFCGSGEYAGVLVLLFAAFAIASSYRQKGPFSPSERKLIWFWTILGVISLLLSYGKYAPFYRLFYALPYASTIRNPMKFMHPLHMIFIILFGYGLQAFYREYLEKNVLRGGSATEQMGKWWRAASSFEKLWIYGCCIFAGIAILSLLVYSTSKRDLAQHLQNIGFPDATLAASMAAFSIKEVAIFVLILLVCFWFMLMMMSGSLSGPRSKAAGIILGLILTVDLVRASVPWVVYWDAKQKYESNAILDILKDKPFEHRVIMFPAGLPQMGLLTQLYQIEWTQQLFQYYNIQSLDIVQSPRPNSDTANYQRAFGSTQNILKEWQLTNTRFFLGMNGQFIDAINQQIDPVQKRFKLHTAFDIAPKAGVTQASTLEQLTATPNPQGQLALIEFTGALPRAKLYSNWIISTNDQAALDQLAKPDFDPAAAVIVDTSSGVTPSKAKPGEDAGTVTYQSYAPKSIVLDVDAKTDSVLLLNDKFQENWKASIDGAPTKIFRANYIMRGVSVPKGKHRVTFSFRPSITGLYASCGSFVVALILLVMVALPSRRDPAASGQQQ